MVDIREGSAAKLEEVLALWARAGSPPSITDDLGPLNALLRHDPQALLLAHAEDGELIGSLIAVWNGWRGSFFRLAVDPAHRRRRIATELVREGEARLRARGAVRIDAIVAADERGAVGLWCALGYKRQEDRVRFVRNFGDP
jgi:ribosomal protein S18 acetylase RimI-like enzyme